MATGNRSPGRILPRHGRRRRGHRHRAVRQGHLTWTRGAAASAPETAQAGIPIVPTASRPATGQAIAFRSMCLPCKRLSNRALAARTRHPVQDASDSGRTSVTSACAPPRAKRNSSACPGCRLAASRRMRPCASRAIAYPRASVLPGSSARSCAGGGQPVARLQAQPRVGLAQLPQRRSPRVLPRGACRACDVPGVARARRRAARALRRGPGGRQPEAQAVQALALMFQALRRRHQLAGGAVEALGGLLQPPLLAARQRARRVHDAAQQLAARSAGQFRRRGRGGRAQVGHEVHDGEVGFMAHAADHRNGAGRDLARQRLVIEAPEIFNAAAAAHQQQGIHFGALIGQPHLRGQPAGRVGALHRGRIDDDGNLRRAPGQCRQHIAQRAACSEVITPIARAAAPARACAPGRTAPRTPVAP